MHSTNEREFHSNFEFLGTCSHSSHISNFKYFLNAIIKIFSCLVEFIIPPQSSERCTAVSWTIFEIPSWYRWMRVPHFFLLFFMISAHLIVECKKFSSRIYYDDWMCTYLSQPADDLQLDPHQRDGFKTQRNESELFTYVQFSQVEGCRAAKEDLLRRNKLFLLLISLTLDIYSRGWI